MTPHDHDIPVAKIDAKLAEVAAVTPAPVRWVEAWRRLSPESTWAERLRVYQAIRDSGTLPAAAGFFLVSWPIDEWTEQQVGEALGHLEAQMTALERQYGLAEDEFWGPGEAPAEYEALRRQHQKAWDALLAENLDRHGEHDMARLLREDPEAFERQSEAGRRFFFPEVTEGSAMPDWLDSLVDEVGEHMTFHAASGPLGYRYHEEQGFWEIMIYPTPVELVGGAMDGEVVDPGFSLDLEGLRVLFEEVKDFSWNALGWLHEGPHVSMEGTCQGHEVFLQVFAHAPEDEKPGVKVDTSPGSAE